jgi:hypothetical protein
VAETPIQPYDDDPDQGTSETSSDHPQQSSEIHESERRAKILLGRHGQETHAESEQCTNRLSTNYSVPFLAHAVL